jgi:hypothetical protein
MEKRYLKKATIFFAKETKLNARASAMAQLSNA